MIPRRSQKFTGLAGLRLAAVLVASAVLLAACGGGDSQAEVATTTQAAPAEATSTTTVAAEEVAPPTTAPTTTAAPEPGSGSISAAGDGTWDGGDFLALVDVRMDEIAATFGQPATPESLGPLFVLPDDFPYPTGTIIGAFHSFDLDQRSDEIDIEEERIVGVDGDPSVAALDALVAVVEADAGGRWQRASSQRDAFNNDLYTAEALDGVSNKDRLVIRADEAPDPGESPVRFHFEAAPGEIPVPAWAAGLPVLEGGTLSSMREGRGVVEDFGAIAHDGSISIRYDYPVDRYEDLEEFMASGVVAAAGFTHEDTPFSNFNIRIDVSQGAWEGTVGVGELTVNSELAAYQLIWSLSRP